MSFFRLTSTLVLLTLSFSMMGCGKNTFATKKDVQSAVQEATNQINNSKPQSIKISDFQNYTAVYSEYEILVRKFGLTVIEVKNENGVIEKELEKSGYRVSSITEDQAEFSRYYSKAMELRKNDVVVNGRLYVNDKEIIRAMLWYMEESIKLYSQIEFYFTDDTTDSEYEVTNTTTVYKLKPETVARWNESTQMLKKALKTIYAGVSPY